MNSIFLASLSLALVMLQINTVFSANDTKLSRRKRYVAFPEGATLSIAICMTIQTIIYRNDEIWTEGLNWGVSYDLPNNTATVQEFLYPKQAIKRRHRRDLYQKMELIMDSMGYKGRNCIQRALCETGRYLTKNKNNVIEEILKIIFGFPHQKILINEPEEHFEYHKAHQAGKKVKEKECFEMFPGCSFSLLDLALGYYSPENLIM